MPVRLIAFFLSAVLVLAAASGRLAAQTERTAADQPAACERTVPAGPLVEPPQIDVASLPLDDLGLHELILRVHREGQAFCFHYERNGIEENVAPTLLVHRGERFALRMVNEISGPASGATMKASELKPCVPAPMKAMPVRRFAGYLNHTMYARFMPMKPFDVNLHLHGFEGPPSQENVFLSTLSTPAHACEYDITIPRTQPPGTYFYHPHAHGMTGPEVGGGLSGMWIVEPDGSQLSKVDQHEIILRARLPNHDGLVNATRVASLAQLGAARESALKIVPPLTAYDPFDPPAWPSAFPLRAGRERLAIPGCGPFVEPAFTVNGIALPARVTVPAGKPQLFRVLNALPNGAVDIRMRDASGIVQTLHIVGRDGVPISADDERPLARYVPMHGVVLGPTMRADILVTLEPGQILTLYSDRHCYSPFDAPATRHDVLTIAAVPSADPAADVVSMPVTASTSRAAQLLRYVRAHPNLIRRRALTYTEYPLRNANGKGLHPQFFLTETSNRNFHEQPYWPSFAPGENTPAHADIVVKKGSIEEWYLFNTTLSMHTFHIHQMAFAAEDERPVPVMLDTVMIPSGRALPNPGDPNYPLIKPSVTRVLLDFRHVPRGEFVYHCHMLLHEDGGMMGVIRVI
jgi:FtsP/CotA-like multicopper oxidase with cupredoxin domain